MDNNIAEITAEDNITRNTRKKVVLAAAQMSLAFLENLQQMNTISTMSFLESSSDEDDDFVENMILRELQTYGSRK